MPSVTMPCRSRAARVLWSSLPSVQAKRRRTPYKAAHTTRSTIGSPDAAKQILAATGVRGVDLCVDVDTTANATLLSRVMAVGGQISSYGSRDLTADIPVRDLRLRCVSIRFLTLHHFSIDVLQSIAAGINAMLEANLLQHRIARIFPLNDIAAAREALESGAVRGKTLLDVSA
ncbi:MAG: zinc-binding dehydrogenase [Alphaproteobacteria bacterium]|nr:zinc-binding dehydrogenase [Alphaproteobacteria bacterium]